MKYIRLPNGKEIEFYSYAVTNALIVKFINTNFDDVKNFFGTSTIQYIEILDKNKKVIEQKDLGGMKRTTINIENGTVQTYEQKLIEDAHDEVITAIIGQDENGNDITEEKTIHHDAVYETISKDVPVEFIVAVLERPSFEEQINEIKEQTGIIDVTTLDLNGWKDYKQEENKKALKDFLDSATVEFNGKQYGVAEEDQNEMALNLTQYKLMKNAGLDVSLEWHSKKEECEIFTEEEFNTLSIKIISFVYPYMSQMQSYKKAIYSCNSVDEVKAINIIYSFEEDDAEEV